MSTPATPGHTETVRCRRRNKEVVMGDGEVRRIPEYQRALKSFGSLFGGLALGVVFFPIPGLHLIAPIVFPIIGLVLAWWFYRTAIVITRVHLTCASCHEVVAIDGGALEQPMWRRCPKCTEPYELLLG